MPALVERPKMSLAMWAALKAHIMKQREKKKQEQEADAAVERLRREQEMKRKQDAMTLEEIRDQLSHLEKKLAELRVEKHELFLYLKRVLNEDEKRRNEEDKEPNDMMQVNHPYPNQGMPVGPSNMYMIASHRQKLWNGMSTQPAWQVIPYQDKELKLASNYTHTQGASNTLMNRAPVMYKVGAPTQQNGGIKRTRSPSPPNAGYPQGYSYKTHLTAFGQKPTSYTTAQNSGYYPHSTATASGTSSTIVVTNSTPYSTYPVQHPGGPYASQDQTKHLTANYHVPHLQQSAYVGTLHQQMEHPNQKPGMQEEKYYIHQSGGISSGYPVRGQPQQTTSRFQPPTSHNTTAPIQVPCRKDDVLRRNLSNETQR